MVSNINLCPYIPSTAQVAFQQADYAAWNIWSAVNARPLLPFKYQHLVRVAQVEESDYLTPR